MKVIYPEKTSAVLADEENANYPDDNVLDDHPKKVWKGTSQDAKLTITVDGGANAVGIFATNAQSIDFTLKDGDGATVETGSYDLTGIDTFLKFLTDTGLAWTELWIDYTYQADSHTVELEFDTEDAGTVIEAGVVRAGLAREFRNPQLKLKEGLRDFSIEKELNNGATYYRLRNIVRTYSGNFRAERLWDFYVFIREIFKTIGAQPLAWQVIDVNGEPWTVYARATKTRLPSGSHDRAKSALVSFYLEEVV